MKVIQIIKITQMSSFFQSAKHTSVFAVSSFPPLVRVFLSLFPQLYEAVPVFGTKLHLQLFHQQMEMTIPSHLEGMIFRSKEIMDSKALKFISQ